MMASEWTIGDGDLVIRFDGAPDEFDLEWFVTLETLRQRQWEDAARVVIVRSVDTDPRQYLPRAGTEEIRLSVAERGGGTICRRVPGCEHGCHWVLFTERSVSERGGTRRQTTA
jgi:hypothetical protein